MDFPDIENVNNFLIDFHVVYAGLVVYLIMKRAGHVFGLLRLEVGSGGRIDKAASRNHRPSTFSSVTTTNRFRLATPKAVDMATSAASRPRPITMRPMRGWL